MKNHPSSRYKCTSLGAIVSCNLAQLYEGDLILNFLTLKRKLPYYLVTN
jgi:hypothetical protein